MWKLMRFSFRLLVRAVAGLTIPVLLADYFKPETGREYGIGLHTKIRLARKMARNESRIPGASGYLEHLVMATRILQIPKSLAGCVVECGSFKGRSAANLSLACALCNRRLQIFDSFEGLPEPSAGDRRHELLNSREIHTYTKGSWRGSLDEVRQNISRYGAIGACDFSAGYFEQTLPDFREPCILAFVDVDLRSSLETCIKYLWPLLHDGCYLFTHEAHHHEIASLFFDEAWWVANTGMAAPGLVGAGSGLGLSPASGGFISCLGYTLKNAASLEFITSAETGRSVRRVG
jgi:O-methyltransferase